MASSLATAICFITIMMLELKKSTVVIFTHLTNLEDIILSILVTDYRHNVFKRAFAPACLRIAAMVTDVVATGRYRSSRVGCRRGRCVVHLREIVLAWAFALLDQTG